MIRQPNKPGLKCLYLRSLQPNQFPFSKLSTSYPLNYFFSYWFPIFIILISLLECVCLSFLFSFFYRSLKSTLLTPMTSLWFAIITFHLPSALICHLLLLPPSPFYLLQLIHSIFIFPLTWLSDTPSFCNAFHTFCCFLCSAEKETLRNKSDITWILNKSKTFQNRLAIL